MADANSARRFHDGAVIPDAWVPVTVGTPIPWTVIALRVGTGGGDITATFAAAEASGITTTLTNVADGDVIDGRFLTVTAVTNTVANLTAAIVL